MSAITEPASSIMASATPSAVTLSWSPPDPNSIMGYQVMCSNENFLPIESNLSYSLNSTHIITVLTNETSVEIGNLVPGLSYNCCVSALEASDTPLDCDMVMLASALSRVIVGVIGALAGAALATAVLLAIVAVVVCVQKRVRKRKPLRPKVVISRDHLVSTTTTTTSTTTGTSGRDTSTILRSNREPPTTTTFTRNAAPQARPDSLDEDTDEFGYLYTSALQVSQRITPHHHYPLPRTEEVRESGESLEDTEQYEIMLATATNPAYKNVPHASAKQGEIYDQVP